jgi:hypothetical protein
MIRVQNVEIYPKGHPLQKAWKNCFEGKITERSYMVEEFRDKNSKVLVEFKTALGGGKWRDERAVIKESTLTFQRAVFWESS